MNAVDEGIVPPEPNDGGGAESLPDNPAWNDFLSAIPQGMHEMVKPHLRKWDEGVNSRIEAVHGEYADYKPFKEAGVTREVLEQAYGIYDAINTDPRRVYDILAETYGYNVANAAVTASQQNAPQGQQNVQPQQSESAAEYELGQGGQFNPEIAQLRQTVETMAQIMLAQNQTAENARADAALDAELAAARAKHGDFDEQYVLAYMQNGMTADQAAQQFINARNAILAEHNRPQAPTVISGAGALPSQQINPAKLSKSDTLSLVANMMKAANQQG
jgi:hypothetical protein